ncbi:unnamed protein product [Acanthosepion pharaonis]|uniref:Uncharacterized protein n=1 Tax=Acanthosepion pharaonis TaxID=158019 RepID=A0A812E6N1_ACAPH|nr:unnamed protein product [Sepia pharaonis]
MIHLNCPHQSLRDISFLFARISFLTFPKLTFRRIPHITWKELIGNNEILSWRSLPNIKTTFLQQRGILLNFSCQHQGYLPLTSQSTRYSLGRLFPSSGLPSFDIANTEVFSWTSLPNIRATFNQHRQQRGLLLDVSSQHRDDLPSTSQTTRYSLESLFLTILLQHRQQRGVLLDVSSQHQGYLLSTLPTTRFSLGRLLPKSRLPSFNITSAW